MVLEYKLFEPAFYTHRRAGLGHRRTRTACTLGPNAPRSCVDTGHHAPGTNIEFIVAFLLRAGKLGAFDFNSRFYADDDLMVGAADPFQLFRIMFEVRREPAAWRRVRRRVHARPVPQHRAEDPRPDPVGDERPGGHRQGPAGRPDALAAAQAAGDVLGANAVLMDAYNTDVRPLLAEMRDGRRASTPTRSLPTPDPATPSASSPTASAAARPAGAPDRRTWTAAPDRWIRPPPWGGRPARRVQRGSSFQICGDSLLHVHCWTLAPAAEPPATSRHRPLPVLRKVQ